MLSHLAFASVSVIHLFRATLASTMSHCDNESTPHDHDHSHGGQSHDHSNDINPALQSHLYTQINFDGIRTLNEANAGSGRKIVEKTWAQRLDPEPQVESDADEQLIIHVPWVYLLLYSLPHGILYSASLATYRRQKYISI